MNYIFIFSLNNSGTTIISQYLSANISSCYLPKTIYNEGLNIEAVRNSINWPKRWDSSIPINYDMASIVWSKLAQSENCNFFLEASPPNMVHVEQVISTFKPENCIFSISNPYLYVGSSINRYGIKDNINREDPMSLHSAIEATTRRWIIRANAQKQNVMKHPNIPLKTYEQFCHNPYSYIEALCLPDNQIITNNSVQQLSGKSTTGIKEIINMTPKYLAFLGAKGIEQISSLLTEQKDLMRFYGYSILNMKRADRIAKKSPLLVADGIIDRSLFEQEWNNKFT